MNRLINSLLKSFHHALDDGDHEVARALLLVVEGRIGKIHGRDKYRLVESVTAAHERLWQARAVAA